MASLSKGGREVSDSDIVKWANDQVQKGGKRSSMRSFKDPSLKNARFFLDLLDSLKPGYVDYELVYEGRNEEECKANGAPAVSFSSLPSFRVSGSARTRSDQVGLDLVVRIR